MLSHLVIRNFAIIDHLEIPFKDGLTVLTGETGAGKSIVINALNLVLGGRASTDVIRTDQDSAVVEAVFQLEGGHVARVSKSLDEIGIDPGAGQLVIRRIVSRSGRNKVFINGSASTVAVLQCVTNGLVDISGQHEHYSLMQKENHLLMLDAFGALEDQRLQMRETFRVVRELRSELEGLQTDERERFNRIDFLRFQLEEIDQASLEPGEDDALEVEFSLLKNAEQINKATRRATYLTYDSEGSAVEKVSEAQAALARLADVDPRLSELATRLDSARITLEDIARELDTFNQGLDGDPATLDRVIARIEMLKRLKLRHGANIEAILAEAAVMRTELHNLENADERTSELEAELVVAETHALEVARSLSFERVKAAKQLQRGILAELNALNMEGAQFEVAFAEGDLKVDGIDDVEFLLAANAGENVKRLGKIASGGELSRIMLAIKSVLAERDLIPTYIFDEVDAGIGGSTADRVGDKIAATSKGHQVLCITHLAQIASRGDHHYLVEKATLKDRTESSVRVLSAPERIEELARMLGGARVTAKTREAAAELLAR